jgi:hypothetical protein
MGLVENKDFYFSLEVEIVEEIDYEEISGPEFEFLLDTYSKELGDFWILDFPAATDPLESEIEV